MICVASDDSEFVIGSREGTQNSEEQKSCCCVEPERRGKVLETMTQIKAMSISSEKIHKRRASVVRTNLLRALLQKYVRKMYGDVVTDRAKLNDRQLIRHEYYNDIFECILNNCQLTKSSSELSSFGHCVLPMTRKERHGSRNASKKGKCIANKLDDVDMNPR